VPMLDRILRDSSALPAMAKIFRTKPETETNHRSSCFRFDRSVGTGHQRHLQVRYAKQDYIAMTMNAEDTTNNLTAHAQDYFSSNWSASRSPLFRLFSLSDPLALTGSAKRFCADALFSGTSAKASLSLSVAIRRTYCLDQLKAQRA
jgi:hypothetical protein